MKKPKSIEKFKMDYQNFIDVQMSKYFEQTGKNEFDSEDAAADVLSKIIETWNIEISQEHERLDTSTIEAKADWFKSIEINFIDENLFLENSKLYAVDEMKSYYDNLFPFLPEGAMAIIIFAGAALEAYGYSFERFTKLFDGEEPTEFEEFLLSWAYDLVLEVMTAYQCLNKNKRDKFIARAEKIAKIELDAKTARKVVNLIYMEMEGFFEELIQRETDHDKTNEI